MRLLPLCLLCSLPALAQDTVDDADLAGVVPAEPGTWFYANAQRDRITVVRDSGGLLLNHAVRAQLNDEVVAKLSTDRAVADLRALDGVASVVPHRPDRGLYVITAAPGADPIELSTRIAETAGVVFAHPDLILDLVPHTTNDPLIGESWFLHNTGQTGGLPGVDAGAFQVWPLATGAGQIIAILDTGVDVTHPDLDVLPGYDFGRNDDDPTPNPEYDGHGHGTAMAGVAAALADNGLGGAGIAPDAQILPVKFIGDGASLLRVHDAFLWSVDQGASVLSNSWGYNNPDCSPFPMIGLLGEAFDYAESEGRDGLGSVVTMSLGNDGCDASTDELHAYPTLVSVGASTDIDRIVGYSNFGTTLDVMGFAGGDGRPGLITTDIQGQGGYVGGASGDFWNGGSGTSSACASVSGVIALMFEANPRLTAAAARESLCDTAVQPAWDDAAWDASGHSNKYGCGRIDGHAAVQAVMNGAPTVVTQAPAVRFDAGVLRWSPQDPDGDVLRYRVVVREQGVETPRFDVETEDTELDVAGLKVGFTYDWTVTPHDAWGPGETIEGPAFTVEPTPEPVKACSGLGSSGSSGLWLAGLLLLGLRRRR